MPTTHQFVCVVNKKIEAPKLLNALGHMAVGLVNQYKSDTSLMRFRDFIDKDQTIHPSTSENGFIVLRSENSNQIRILRNKLIEENIPYTDFTQTMVPGTYVDQQNEFDKTAEADLEYFGVCFFAEKDKARELTKKFSLYVG
ncbi:MAG: DUF2000 domain-containing protein [bacterium]